MLFICHCFSPAIFLSLLFHWSSEKTKTTSTFGIRHTNNADIRMIEILFSLNACACAWLKCKCGVWGGSWKSKIGWWMEESLYVLLSSFCHHHLMLCFCIYLYFLLQLFGKWIWIVCFTIYFLIAVNLGYFVDISCRISSAFWTLERRMKAILVLRQHFPLFHSTF